MLKKSDWFAVLGIAALWVVTRALWGDCDPGVPSMWEYGYNATDEGYYLVGGKEKFVQFLQKTAPIFKTSNYVFLETYFITLHKIKLKKFCKTRRETLRVS
jgi:hypothetical protein